MGGVTDENRRTVTLPFDYLDPGKEYVATLYADAQVLSMGPKETRFNLSNT